MKQVVYILVATALTYACSYALGSLLLRTLSVKMRRGEERFLSFIAGSGLLSTIVFLLTAAQVAYKGVFLAASAVIIAAGFWRRAYLPVEAMEELEPLRWRIAFWILFLGFGWFYVGNALAPECSPDGVAYHVALPAHYLRDHGFRPITTNMYANLSQGIEMLFEYAFSIGKHSAAAMVHFLFLLTLPFGLRAYGRRIGRPRAGMIAALLVYLSPVFGRDGTVAYVDVAAAAVVFAMFYALELWREQRTTGAAILAGLLAGFGFAVKYTLGVGVPLVLGAIVAGSRRHWKQGLRAAAAAALFAAVMMAPWLIKNWLFVHNPVSPFYNTLFPNPYVYASFEQQYREFFRHMNGVQLPEIPAEATVRGERLAGLLGPVFLLLPFALLALRRPEGRRLLLAGAVFLVPYFGNIGTRFLMSSIPFLALALAMVLDEFRLVSPLVVALHALLSWPSVLPLYAGTYAWRLERPNWSAALRITPEETYLLQARDDHQMVRRLDAVVPAGEAIFSPAIGNSAYHTRNLIGPFESRLGNRTYDMLFRATIDDLRTTRRLRFHFPALTARRLRVVINVRNDQPLAISEVRLWNDSKELPRDPSWRLRASVNPWEVQSAFDNSPLTVWTVGQRTEPGMFLQIDLGAVRTVDEVTVDVPEVQRWADSQISVDSGDGVWKSVPNQPTQDKLDWPPRMRRAAIEEMKASGFRWLLLRDGELLADDFVERSAQWGVHQVEYANRCRLWRLE